MIDTTDKSPIELIQSPAPKRLTLTMRAWRAIINTSLTPIGWLVGALLGAPGMAMRWRITYLAIKMFLTRKISVRLFAHLLMYPMDSTRYFEFDICWRWLSDFHKGHYLDLSSPRMFPTLLLHHHPALLGQLVNPDRIDLAETSTLTVAAGVGERAKTIAKTIADLDNTPSSLDVITSISVIEHIGDDADAVTRLWALLRPGGRLLVTLPCAAKAIEQRINSTGYGILPRDDDGYTFWQRLYDEDRIQKVFVATAGKPTRTAIYGEKHPGSFSAMCQCKRSNPYYPIWSEAVQMAYGWRLYASLAELPGEGVIALEFTKQ